MTTVRIALADSQPVFRYGLKLLLSAAGGFEIVGESGSCAETVDLVTRLQPDLLFVDLNLRGGGLETLKALVGLPTPVRVLVLMDPVQPDWQSAAMRLGARGVLGKESSTSLFVQAIRAVMQEQHWFDGQVHTAVKDKGAQHTPAAARKYRLTRRELQVVAAVADGETNKGIAERFRVSEDTVKHHLSNVFDKVGVSSRLELAVFAFTHGLVMLENGLVMIHDGGISSSV
jgi:DNA-binding NarL/FixJ family response regulator